MRRPLVLGVPLGLESTSRRSDAALPRSPQLVERDPPAPSRRVLVLRRVAAHRLHAIADRIEPQPAAC